MNQLDPLCHLRLDSISIDQESHHPVIILREYQEKGDIFPLFIDPFSFKYLMSIFQDSFFKKRFLVDLFYEQNPVTAIFLEYNKGEMIAYYETEGIKSKELSLIDALAFVVRYRVPVIMERAFVTPLMLEYHLFQGEKDQLEHLYKKRREITTYIH